MLSLIKVEQQNLNCIWDNPSFIYKFDRRYFISEIAESIFQTIKYLYESDVKITVDQVVTYGNSKNSAITTENLENLRKQEYNDEDFNFYFLNLKKNYSKVLIEEKILKDTIINVSSKGELDLEKLQDLTATLLEHIDIIQGKESSIQTIEQVATRYRGVMVDRRRGDFFFSTGDSALDRNLALGFVPGQITTIYGSSGVGKSTLAVNLFSKQINRRIPTMMMSLEMDEISSMDRLIALRNKIPHRMLTFRDEALCEDPDIVFSLLEKGLKDLEDFKDNFLLLDDPSISLKSDLEKIIREAKLKMKTDYLICTIDLFTMMHDIGIKPQEIEEAMNILSSIAKKQKVHFVVVVQANRASDSLQINSIEEIDRLRPKSINNIKNSQAIAERSRLVLSVFRPRHYAVNLFPEDPSLEFMDDIMQVTVLKQNQGEVGNIVEYLYEPQYFRLIPYIREEFNE
jgi:replicative DNA helicase